MTEASPTTVDPRPGAIGSDGKRPTPPAELDALTAGRPWLSGLGGEACPRCQFCRTRAPRASSISARMSCGVGTSGAMFGIGGGSAHCAGFESLHLHRHAGVNIDERHAWVWYTLRADRPRPWCARRGRPASWSSPSSPASTRAWAECQVGTPARIRGWCSATDPCSPRSAPSSHHEDFRGRCGSPAGACRSQHPDHLTPQAPTRPANAHPLPAPIAPVPIYELPLRIEVPHHPS